MVPTPVCVKSSRSSDPGTRRESRCTRPTPEVPVKSGQLSEHARALARQVRDFSLAVQRMLFRHREQILFRQYVQERIADAACELYASACTLARLDDLLGPGNGNAEEARREAQAGRYYLRLADRRVRQCLAALSDNDDDQTTATADAALAGL